METTTIKNKRKGVRVPAELPVVGTYGERSLTMWTEYVYADGMLLSSQEYVRPRAVFEAQIWIPSMDRTLHVFLSVVYVERTFSGFGIGVTFSAISEEDRQSWEALVGSAMGSHGRDRSAVSRKTQPAPRRAVMVGQALPPTAVEALEQRGLSVRCVRDAGAALDAARSAEADLVLCDLAGATVDGIELCRGISAMKEATGRKTEIVLFTARAAQDDFVSGVYAGATRVIAKPCSHEVLVAQLTSGLVPQAVRINIPVLAERPAPESAPASKRRFLCGSADNSRPCSATCPLAAQQRRCQAA